MRRIAIFIAAIGLAATVWLSAQPRNGGLVPQKWEYTTESCGIAKWNDLGKDGWELVAATPQIPGTFRGEYNKQGQFGFSSEPADQKFANCMAVFKRGKPTGR
jgi:hypothetical protein